MKIQFILFFISLLLNSCFSRTHKLTEEDFKWMPYKGDETLVFKSNTGDTNRIFILEKDTVLDYPEAQALNGRVYEVVSVFCNHYSRDNQGKGRTYDFFKVQKAKDNRTEMVFDLSFDDIEFDRIRPVKIDSLTKMAPIKLQTSFGQYDDVYIIYPDDIGMYFENRSSFVTKLYWSKSNGLVRYDKKDNVYWELEKNGK
jgi:hypothetical protein